MEINDLLYAYRGGKPNWNAEKIARDAAKERGKTKGRKARWNKAKIKIDFVDKHRYTL